MSHKNSSCIELFTDLSFILDLDTHENTNFAWHPWIMTKILITWKAVIGKIVLRGSLGEEVTHIF
jgi:hypothetical protein